MLSVVDPHSAIVALLDDSYFRGTAGLPALYSGFIPVTSGDLCRLLFTIILSRRGAWVESKETPGRSRTFFGSEPDSAR